jgi:DNA-binding IclR family transcriptional regulator
MREIAETLGLPSNSVFRITGALEAMGYISRETEDMRYRLTRKLLSLGYAAIGEDKLVEHSLDVMRGLRDETRETVLIGIRVEQRGLVLEQVASPLPVKFLVDPGSTFPLHTSAPGKALVAYMPETERVMLLAELEFPRFTEHTITTRPAFEAELASVRSAGFALDCSEEIEGLHCVGAPIFNQRGHPIAALWVTGPSFRFPKANLTNIGKQVADAAARISKRFGYGLLA